MTYIDGIALAIAILGAVLGIINTWYALDRDRVKLHVIPKHAIFADRIDSDIRFCIEVINLSTFPLTISEVGFLYKRSSKRRVIITPILSDGGSWPRRLEPHSSVTIFMEIPESIPGTTIKCAYATTDCGHIIKGNSPALKQIGEESK